MRKAVVVAVLACVVALLVWLLSGPRGIFESETPKLSNSLQLETLRPPAPTQQLPPEAAELNAVAGDGQSDVEALHSLIRQYLVAMQKRPGPPIGDDLDLARILLGRNPLQQPLIVGPHPAFSNDGHIRDRWGTPYHIHGISSGSYEVRSAGPDRRLFTQDDLICPQAK